MTCPRVDETWGLHREREREREREKQIIRRTDRRCASREHILCRGVPLENTFYVENTFNVWCGTWGLHTSNVAPSSGEIEEPEVPSIRNYDRQNGCSDVGTKCKCHMRRRIHAWCVI